MAISSLSLISIEVDTGVTNVVGGAVVGAVVCLCLGWLSFEPGGRPRLARGADSVASLLIICIWAGAFAAPICARVAAAASLKASGGEGIHLQRRHSRGEP